jgi:DNA-binding response OmpR family regulator
MPKKILVVDDEVKIIRLLQVYLEQAGFQVVSAGDGRSALSVFQDEQPDFVILDLNLPGLDGLEVCREIRQESRVPVLMLTARAEEADKLVGLELGADDYVVKPFSPREVVARIRTVFRRVGNAPAGHELELIYIANVQIDPMRHEVTRDGQTIELTPTEFDLLSALAGQPGRVFTRQQLLDTLQGNGSEGFERTVDVHIKNLRLKLETDPKNPAMIQTVFGVGYKIEKIPE